MPRLPDKDSFLLERIDYLEDKAKALNADIEEIWKELRELKKSQNVPDKEPQENKRKTNKIQSEEKQVYTIKTTSQAEFIELLFFHMKSRNSFVITINDIEEGGK